MSQTDAEISAYVGSAVVTNTMICEASRLLARDFGGFGNLDHPDDYFAYSAWKDKYASPLIDLCSLIEAVVLYDQLYTLPCRLKSDAEDLELRRNLVDSGIVQELDTSKCAQSIAGLIIDGLAQIKNVGTVSDPTKYVDFKSQVKPELLTLLHSDEDADRPFAGREVPAQSFEQLGRTVISGIQYRASGAYEYCTSLLRDMYYVFAAEAFRIPYWPQMGRMEFAKHFPNHFDKDTRTALYQKMADGLKAALSEVAAEFEETIAFIPPFASLVLQRSSKPSEIIVRTFELRDEMRVLRRDLAALEHERIATRSLAKRKAITLKRAKLLDQLSKSFDRPDSVWFQNIIRYIPELVKPALSPADPTKYSANLVLQPIEWIVHWWQRRPIAMFFDVSSRIAKMDNYKDLVAKVFGPEMARASLRFDGFSERFKQETLPQAAFASES